MQQREKEREEEIYYENRELHSCQFHNLCQVLLM
jgi:hypothetical protein